MNGKRTFFLLSITGACNRGCDYCIVKEFINSEQYKDDIDKDKLYHFFAQAEYGDLVEITGGEPTLVPWIEEFVEYLDSKGVYVCLRTNGINLFKNIYKRCVVVLNPHDEGKEYLDERRPLLRETDIILGETCQPEKITLENKKGEHLHPKFEANELTPLTRHPFLQCRSIFHTGIMNYFVCWNKIKLGTINYSWKEDPNSQEFMPCPKCEFIVIPWNFVWRLGLEN